MKASVHQVSGILGLCVSCWHALTTCELCSVLFKKLSLSNWPEREVQHSLCVHSFSFFFFWPYFEWYSDFFQVLCEGRSLFQDHGPLANLHQRCVCIQTQNWARLPRHCILQRKNVSTPEPTPLNKVQQKGHSSHLGFSRMGIKLGFFLKDGPEP